MLASRIPVHYYCTGSASSRDTILALHPEPINFDDEHLKHVRHTKGYNHASLWYYSPVSVNFPPPLPDYSLGYRGKWAHIKWSMWFAEWEALVIRATLRITGPVPEDSQ